MHKRQTLASEVTGRVVNMTECSAGKVCHRDGRIRVASRGDEQLCGAQTRDGSNVSDEVTCRGT